MGLEWIIEILYSEVAVRCCSLLQVWQWMVAPGGREGRRRTPLPLAPPPSGHITRQNPPLARLGGKSVLVAGALAVYHHPVVSHRERVCVCVFVLEECARVKGVNGGLISFPDWIWNGKNFVQVSKREWKIVSILAAKVRFISSVCCCVLLCVG